MSLNGGIKLPLLTANPAESPAEGFIFAYVVGTSVRYKDASGNVYTLSTGITAEEVEDIIGNILQDSDSIDFTYDDEGNAIRAIVKQAGIIHDQITGHGTNSHATIDAHLAATDNPHATTKGQVGLGNCDNTSDVNKPISSATQTALNAKVDDSQVGAANGVASLDSSGKVPTAQLPSSFGGDTNAVLASDTNNSSSSTFVTLTNMGFSAVSGKIYRFEAMLRFKTAASSTGMGVTMNTSDTAVGDMCALVDIPSANDGPGAVYHGSVSSLGDVVTSTAVQASNTYFLARIKGIFVCTTGGTIVPLFRSEVNGSQVTIGAGSVTTWREIA